MISNEHFSNLETSIIRVEINAVKKINAINRRKLIVGGSTIAGMAAINTLTQNTQATAQQPIVATPNSSRFAGKVVLITGATSGIGETTARMFAKEDAIVHFCGRRENLGAKIAQEININGGRASYQKADVRNEQEVKSFVDNCVQKYGRIDIVFNNAGIESKPFTVAEQSLNNWLDVMTTNSTGVFLSMKYELPQMLRQGGGVIINNASVSGHVGFATIAPYSASKHAIMSLTKVAALEYANKNIRVNSISPGAVDTPTLRRALAAWKTDLDTVAKDYPICANCSSRGNCQNSFVVKFC